MAAVRIAAMIAAQAQASNAAKLPKYRLVRPTRLAQSLRSEA
jgi:hypothetical protein